MSVNAWQNETLGRRAVEALKKNNFDAVYCATLQEATECVMKFIDSGANVGMGGSVTTTELEMAARIRAKGATPLIHGDPGLSPEERMAIRRAQLVSDVFLTSTNALTLDGCLVNVDGTGNRVAAMMFGPKKVVIVAGANKIVPDVHAALERIRLIAGPKNNRRLNLTNPCTVEGTCQDCQGKSRICNIYSVLKKKPSATDITVVVVGESLGY